MLGLTVENDFDANGLALMGEFSDCISAYITGFLTAKFGSPKRRPSDARTSVVGDFQTAGVRFAALRRERPLLGFVRRPTGGPLRPD